MHWFWRAAIVVVASVLIGTVLPFRLDLWMPRPVYWMDFWITHSTNHDPDGWAWRFSTAMSYLLPTVLATLASYGLLSWFLGPVAAKDCEPRCRKCRYILRGISEPRCPECGERI
jgi:hypothetical protein